LKHFPLNRHSFFALPLLLLAVTLQSCSQPGLVREPTPLVKMSSPYSLHKDWQLQSDKFKYSDSEGLYFAENKNAVFFANPDGVLTSALKANQNRWTDQVLWQRKFNEPILSGPTIFGSNLIIGTAKGSLMSVSQDSGEIIWRTELSSEVLSLPVIVDNTIFVRTVDGKLDSVNAVTGKINWTVEHQLPNLSLRGIAPVTYANDTLYVGWESGSVQALDAKTGETKWQTQVLIPKGRTDLERMVDIQSELILKSGRLYVLGYHGKLVALNPENGNLFWSKDVSGFRDFLVDDKAVYLADEDDILHAYDLYTGTEIWKQTHFKYRVLTDLSFYNNNQILVADGYGVIHWVDKLDGTLVARARHSSPDSIRAKIVRVWNDGKRIYIQDTGGYITAYTVEPSDWYEFNHPEDPMGILKTAVKKG
jgi:outer membrane assembly lipoprotein YfgL